MTDDTLPVRLDELIDYTKRRHPDGGAPAHLTDAVLVADRIGEVADHLVGHFVDQARRDGASWTEIGQAIGVSKQAAQKRFVPRPVDIGADKVLTDRLTNRAKQVAVVAQECARQTGHAQVSSAHLVRALVGETQGLAALAVQAQGAEIEQIREAAGAVLGSGGQDVPEHVPYGTEAKKVMQIALREALRFGHNYVGTEHILLGMLRAEETAGARVLTDAGVTREQSEQWILAALEGYRRARNG